MSYSLRNKTNLASSNSAVPIAPHQEYYTFTGNQLHLRVKDSSGGMTGGGRGGDSSSSTTANGITNGFKNLDIATEDNEDEENINLYLKEKYSNDFIDEIDEEEQRKGKKGNFSSSLPPSISSSSHTGSSRPYYNEPAVSQLHHVKPVILFSFDISHWSAIFQYIFLIGGLIVFMCLYGYYQELVIYGWFNRKLSIFSTFLHFAGCTAFAQLQRNLSSPSSSLSSSSSSTSSYLSFPPSTSLYKRCLSYFYWFLSRWNNISMGNATTKIAIGYYLLLVITKTASQGLSNLSMSEINYPAKVLFKSANPIITIILGVCWFGKSYPLRDYIVVFLLIAGLVIFITGDMRVGSRPECTSLGIFYVVLSMICSAAIPMIQEYCIVTYNASVEDLLYYSFLGKLLSLFPTFSPLLSSSLLFSSLLFSSLLFSSLLFSSLLFSSLLFSSLVS
jgi:drug/metabolite transporter (DMT)-like permease